MKAKAQNNRSVIIQRIIIAAALILLYKVAEIQIFDPSYRQKADSTTLDRKTLYPSRGLIYDRNGDLLVYNDPIYDIKVIYNKLDGDMDRQKFCQLLKIDEKEFEDRLEKDWNNVQYSKSVPFVFMKNVLAADIAMFEESLHEFPGFSLILRNVRGYQHPIAAHIMGYISEVDKETVENGEGVYTQGDYIGTTGIEHRYEEDLRGKKGVSYILKDNVGRDVGKLDNGRLDSAAISGKNIVLSIDRKLQAYGEALLNGKKGSVVALDPNTGEILAMVSSPNYDPALLTIHKNRGAAYQELQNDTLKPFFNRGVMAEYPPGSIFKPVLSLIAMQEGTLNANKTYYCDGAYTYRHFSYGCHDHSTPWNVPIAIQQSCNTYFYQVFREVIEQDGFSLPEIGLKRLNQYLYSFGLGQKISTDIEGEKRGNVPSVDYYNNLYGESRWRSTYIISLGIGQGELQLTTLQMANLAAIIGNRGYYRHPHLLKGYYEENHMLPLSLGSQIKVPIDDQYFDPVIDGMARAVKMGTARIGNHPTIEMCGKTGTSENVGKDHSVYFAFAPKNNPKIAIAVYIENGGWGATYAVPIGSLMIEKYLTDEIIPQRLWLEERMLNANILGQS